MKLFLGKNGRQAPRYAADGGQGLHVYRAIHKLPDIPKCFRACQLWGHLFDLDTDRLRATARMLGLKKIVVDRSDEAGQHIDLCGRALERAAGWAECDRILEMAAPEGCTAGLEMEPGGGVGGRAFIRTSEGTPLVETVVMFNAINAVGVALSRWFDEALSPGCEGDLGQIARAGIELRKLTYEASTGLTQGLLHSLEVIDQVQSGEEMG